MRIKVSDYIAQEIVKAGITDAFTIVGGGAMHLNDSFGHCPGLKCYYNHHEQGSAIAAEAYARVNNKMALLCVTTGPGGTNAITGVVGGWLDSIPMIVISGQVRYDTTVRSTGLPLRGMGDQEFDITKAVCTMTKYSEMVIDPKMIGYCLHKALYIATHGRPGPCWLDIPLNVQGAYVDTDEMPEYDVDEYYSTLPMSIDDAVIDEIVERISNAERPVFYAGNGIRLSGAYELFLEVIKKLNIPVVTNWDSIDLIADDDRLYAGRAGSLGDRAGNFAVQNSDLILSVGSRLSLRQTGFNWSKWATKAFVIMEDVDEAELKKPTLHVEMPLHVDAKILLQRLNDRIHGTVFTKQSWIDRCNEWKMRYPVVQRRHYEDTNLSNPYCFMRELSRRLPEGMITVVGNGTACAVGSHAYMIKKGQRFIVNSAIASMGYDLPAGIGACVANGCKDVVCIAGDGSVMMNIQELQTMVTNKLPLKLFIINNSGYHSIRLTQTNLFNKNFCGIGEQSGDLGFPSFEKLAYAFDIPYRKISSNDEMSILDDVLSMPGYVICEVFVNTEQAFEPKSATKKLPDGTLYSPPLEDMAPFLDREELERNMYI
ncbi:MAG: thiamine pyrophosphate-binding protein [Candidatus Methanomethylophilaceae archaeon]|nr:thiamine pyrophosphate-binding protein [Candidatus Methanomethylophilaceae archaeon]